MKRVLPLLFLAGFFLFLGLTPAGAQVSLGGADQSDVVVKVDGVDETFTILRDYAARDQFYYVPNAPRIATRGAGDKKKPIFHLLSYQTMTADSKDFEQGGILQFSVRLAPPSEVVEQMREKIATQFSVDRATLKLSPLRFKTAEVSIYDLEGDLLTTAFQKPGIAPAFANAEIPFQVQLNSLTGDTYKALTTGGAGIPVFITYTFDQITPEVGFKVTLDYDKSFSHFSEDRRTKTAYTKWYYYRTWWGGWRSRADVGQNESRQETLSEVLQENQCLKYESVADQNFTQDEINRYMDPIIEQLSKELVETIQPPEKIEPAAAREPGNATLWSGTSTYAMKSINKVRKGKQVVEMKRRTIFESKSTYGSHLGIGEYESIKDQLITVMQPGNWDYAYFPVPSVGDTEDLAIKKIELQVVPRFYDKNGAIKQIKNTVAELVTLDPKKGEFFLDRKGNQVENILFALQGITSQLASQKVPLASCCYEVNTTVTQGNNIMKFTSFEEFLIGGIPVSTPMACIEGVEIDCEQLKFSEETGKLYQVDIKIESTYPKKTYKATIKPNTENKAPVFLVEKEDLNKKNPVIATIMFLMVGGEKVAWKHNGRNLQDSDLGLSQTLWNEDYQKTEKK